MSQAGEIDIIGTHPQIPIQFDTDNGDAVPIGNVLEILTAVDPPGTTPLETTGSGNTVTIHVQKTQAVAASDASKIGLANFDSTAFSVDANGFVSLKGGGLAIDSIGTQTGTNPIAPTAAGLVTINGAVVAAGTNPVRSDGTGANTMALEVQISQAIAATDATKIGLSNYNSSHFSVDANGFVSLAGGGEAIDSLTPNSGTSPVVPDSSGNIALQGTGSITTVGGTNSLVPQLTGLTNHALLVGAGTPTITSLGPTATAGQVLQSAGSSADPAFSTTTYPLTTTINQILYSSAANTVTGLASANRGVLTTSSTGVPAVTTINGNGLLIIGSGSSQPAAANITPGTDIGITNGANSITVNYTGQFAGLTYVNSTFTPAITFGGGNTGVTYSVRAGYYTQIGAMVSITLDIELSSKGSSTGVVSVTGLPIAAASSANAYYTFTGYILNAASFPTTTVVIIGITTASSSNIDLYAMGTNFTQFQNTNFANNTFVRINGFYRV